MSIRGPYHQGQTPTAEIELEPHKKIYEEYRVSRESLADRVRHVIKAAFNGKRIVIFSGGEAKSEEAIIEEIRQIAKGGGFGSIMGRNAFQRPKSRAIELLHRVQDILVGKEI